MSISYEAEHPAHRMGWWILASLMLHLFLLSIWALIPKNFWKEESLQSKKLDAAPAITFIMVPDTAPPIPVEKKNPRAFIPTLPSQAVEKENPSAVLESDQNTKLRSREQGRENSDLPQQTGDSRAGISYTQIPASRPSPQKPGASQQTENNPTQQVQQPQQQQTNPEEKKDSPTLSENGIPIFPQKTPPNKPQTLSATPRTQTENKPNQTASPMSFAREKSQLAGGHTAEVGESSPEAKSTDLGRYKSKMFRSIGSRWYIMVDQQLSLLAIGAIKVKFFVQANGVIRDIQIESQNGRTEILEKISIRSVRDSGPFEPFSDNLKQQLGEGYWEDISFSIY